MACTGIVLIGFVSAPVYMFNFKWGKLLQNLAGSNVQPTGIHVALLQLWFLIPFYLLAVFVVFRKLARLSRTPGLTIFVFIAAVFFRICLLPTTPVLSSDVYRYVWDGRLQEHGINPYLLPPAAKKLTALRDRQIYPHINRRDHPTVYPAGAQIFFFLAHGITGDSIYRLKAILVACDVLTLVLLLGILRASGLEAIRLLVYAWNPVVIYEIAHSGHLEALMILLVLLAFYLAARHRSTLAVLSLAAAAASKFYPALLFPALVVRGERVKLTMLFCSALLVSYIPYMAAGSKVLGFLPTYLTSPYESFNLGLKHYLMQLFPAIDYFFLSKVFAAVLVLVALFVFTKDKNFNDMLKYSYLLISVYLLLMPAAFHPWYLLWLIPLLAFYPSPAWLLFSGTVVFSYLKYVSPRGLMPGWVVGLEYIPLFILLTVECVRIHGTTHPWFPWMAKNSLPERR